MEEIRKIVQKLSREKSLRPAVVTATAYELVQKYKVTPGILGWFND